MPTPRRVIPLAAPHFEDIAIAADLVSQERGGEPPIQVALVAAVGLRETWFGTCPGYHPHGSLDGVGDGGHGRGIFQIDDRHEYAHLVKPAPWSMVDQARAACTVLANARRDLAEFADHPLFDVAVACRYNARLSRVLGALRTGLHPNTVTTGKDYGSDVLSLRDALLARYPERLKPERATPRIV